MKKIQSTLMLLAVISMLKAQNYPGGVGNGLKLWLKGDAISGKTDNTKISSWTNSAANGFGSPLQSNTANQPSFFDGAGTGSKMINYNPSVFFDGKSNSLVFNNDFLFSGNRFAYFGVVLPGAQDNAVTGFIGPQTSADCANNPLTLTFKKSGGSFSLRMWDLIDPIEDSVISQYKTGVYGALWLNGHGNKTLYNGRTLNISSSIANTALMASNSTIGTAGGVNFFKGNVPEVIFYDIQSASISPLQISQVESYLGLKYGITLAHDYISSNGTAYYNISTTSPQNNTGFTSNVFGIGTDISSGLTQQVSTSQNSWDSTRKTGLLAIATTRNFTAANNDPARNAALADQQYIAIGDNNGSMESLTSIKAPAGIQIPARIWKVQGNAASTNVFFQFDLNNSVSGSSPVSNAVLLYNAAGGTDFTNAQSIPLVQTSAGLWSNATGFAMASGSTFTLGLTPKVQLSSPGGVKGATVWLRADSIANAVDGNAVDRWNNIIYGSPVASPTAAAGSQPVFSTNGTRAGNFNPAVYFGGGSNYLSFSDLAFDSTVFTAFVVAENDLLSPASNSNSILALPDGCDNVAMLAYAGLVSLRNSFCGAPLVATNQLSANNNYLYGFVYGASTDASSMLLNGFNNQTDQFSSDYTVAPNSQLGGRTGGPYGPFYWDGNMQEVIMYPTASLTPLQTTRIESYLGLKYGITLAHDYVSSDSLVYYNISTIAPQDNTGFGSNVFGIGTDSTSGLSQQVSASQNSWDGARKTSLLTIATTPDFVSANGMALRGTPLANGKFIVIGDDNNAVAGFSSVGAPAGKSKIRRTWKVQSNTASTNVYLQFDVNNAVSKISSSTVSDAVLLYNATGGTDFTNAQSIPLTQTSNGLWSTATGTTLASGSTFTLGLTAKLQPASPGGVKGATVWLRADSITGLANGDGVSTWSNLIYDSPVSSPTGAPGSQPVFKTVNDKPTNFNPAVYFGGGSNYLSFSDLAFDSTVFTAFVVAENDELSPTSNSNSILALPDGCDNVSMLAYAGLVSLRNSFCGAPLVATNQLSANNNYLYGFVYGGSKDPSSMLLNGFNNQTEQFPSDYTVAPNSQLGGRTGGPYGPFYWNGNMQEVIMYPTASLTPLQTNRIESYLGLKYGITLAHDYVNSASATMYAPDDTYKNNIIGIVKDSASGFLQKQSHTMDDSIRLFAGGTVMAADNATNTGILTNDLSGIIMADDGGSLSVTATTPMPAGILLRMGRTWKITNTNMNAGDAFAIEIKPNTSAAINYAKLRLLVSSDNSFSTATTSVLAPSGSFQISQGSIIISGITNAQIPAGTSYITVGYVDAALPVLLIDFTAEVQNRNTVLLNWATSSEINSKNFEVYRSANAQDWKMIASVAAAGNSNTKKEYSVTDKNPLQGKSYYRLKQIDLDGNAVYSKIATVTINDKSKLVISPSPTTGWIKITGSSAELASIMVLDETGRVLITLPGNNERTSQDINLGKFASGTYFIKTSTMVSKVVKN